MMMGSRRVVTKRRSLLLVVVVLTTIVSTTSAFTFVVPPSSLTSTIKTLVQQQQPQQTFSLTFMQQSSQEECRTSTISIDSSIQDDHHQSCSRNLSWNDWKPAWTRNLVTLAVGMVLWVAPNMAMAENELSAKYGNSGFDTSLVDQTCLLDHCSLQAKACLQDDPDCRKGLTCTAKCLGDNACITGCMARYGDAQLDNLLKCTIEDHECIKVAILPGGSDVFGEEPQAPAPTISNFDVQSLQGSWYKVVGYNPNYDCYACQRNTFNTPPSSSSSSSTNTLQMDVEFSMPHLLPDGSPLPPSGERETLNVLYDNDDNSNMDTIATTGLKSMALNDYHTNEIMIFDTATPNHHNLMSSLVLRPGTTQEQSYSRTAHSEGEMFGLSTFSFLAVNVMTAIFFLYRCSHTSFGFDVLFSFSTEFWENWYIIGENDKDTSEEFKFVYYNGKTRQNTYEGAFVYSRTKDLSPDSMKKVYQIAQNAGMDPKQFCRIRNGCFPDENPNLLQRKDADMGGWGSPNNPFRGILASTRVSELLGVEPVAARDMLRRNTPTAPVLTPDPVSTIGVGGSTTTSTTNARHWWYEVGDYLENPHRHFAAMSQLRQPMVWPNDIVESSTDR